MFIQEEYEMGKVDIVRQLSFGKRIAEEETGELSEYFVETEHWRKIREGTVDIVYGSKGSGTSAIYAYLLQRKDELDAEGTSIIAAENVRGAPAFTDLATDPPTSEREFIGLWKLFFLQLVGQEFVTRRIQNDHANK